MDIKVGDKFEDKNEEIVLIIDKIEGTQIYHHTIGSYTSIPHSEIKSIKIFEWMINTERIKRI